LKDFLGFRLESLGRRYILSQLCNFVHGRKEHLRRERRGERERFSTGSCGFLRIEIDTLIGTLGDHTQGNST